MKKGLHIIILFFLSLTFVSIPGKLVISKNYIKTESRGDSLLVNPLPESIDTIHKLNVNEALFRGGLLYDINNNKIVWGKDIKNSFPIASLTKMMVALITVEDIKSGKFDWNDKIKVPREAGMVGGSRVFLKKGTEHTVNELLHAAMIASGNDACYTLAYCNGGTEKNFVERMNARALELGMNSTRYSNCTGMPAARGEYDNYSSPHDLLILATELLKHDEILNISCKTNECLQNGYRSFTLRNHNGLVKEYDEINGLKTGWTNHAGYCIVATANRNGHQMVSIVLGAPKVYIRNNIVASMLNDYYVTIGLGKMGEAIDSCLTKKANPNVSVQGD